MSGEDRREDASKGGDEDLDLAAPVLVGFGITGQAVARALVARGSTPTVVDDRPSEAARAVAAELAVPLIEAPDDAALATIITGAGVVFPTPGLPERHRALVLARRHGVPIRSEFDLARLWDRRPVIAITGTNGKTTVTLAVTSALNRAGIRAEAVGNTEVPLVAAIDDPGIERFVTEASSFRLGHSGRFTPAVATWLNFAPDHLDNHGSLAAYEAAKAVIWRDLDPDALVVANAEDPVVMAHRPAGVTTVTFGLNSGDWRIVNDHLVGPHGAVVAVADLPRRQPHDLANAAAIAATATGAGADLGSIAETLVAWEVPPHRLQLVGRWSGVTWYNDSKATVPHATQAAVGGFGSVVLIAGGRNKGLDLSPLSATVPPVRAVVAIGDAAEEVEAVFAPHVEVRRADSMAAAVDHAAALARPGDTVVLSPSCTSYDWYRSYGERGDDFTRLVLAREAR